MKKIRISAVICALVMVLGAAAPVSEGAFSADNLVVASAESAAFEGCCGKTDENDGKNVTWLLDADGTLTISGTGEMNDFFYDRSVWIGDERIKKVIIEEGVTSVGGSAFKKCTNLKNVILPQSVDYIGSYAFSESGLQSIVMPDHLRGMGSAVFSGCKSLESLVIPEGITQIDTMCNNCTALKKVTLPSTLKSIMWHVFENCSSLEEINIPESVTWIGAWAFEGSKWLEDNLKGKDFFAVNGILIRAADLSGVVAVPDGVRMIGGTAFLNRKNVTKVKLPESCELIGDYGFYKCDSLKTIESSKGLKTITQSAFCNLSSLETVVFPDSIRNIETSSFKGCKNLKSVTLPDVPVSVSTDAFAMCPNLKSITLPASAYSIANGAFGYDISYYDLANKSEEYINSKKVPGFTVYGYEGTLAETYAKNNGFDFVALKEQDPCDFDGDGTVDVNDLIIMQKCVAGWKVKIARTLFDIDRDGAVNVDDLLLMQKIVAGWKIHLKK